MRVVMISLMTLLTCSLIIAGKIHDAAKAGSVEGVRAAMKQGANVGDRDHHGHTPLHIAAGQGHIELVEFLLKNDADPNGQANEMYTPLHVVARSFKSPKKLKKVTELLLAKGASWNAKDKQGRTPLSEAKRWRNKVVTRAIEDRVAKN